MGWGWGWRYHRAHTADGPQGRRAVWAPSPCLECSTSRLERRRFRCRRPIRWRASARLRSSSLVRWESPGRSGAPCASSKRRSGWQRRLRPPGLRGQKLARNGLRARRLRRGHLGVRKSRPLRSVQEASGDWARRESICACGYAYLLTTLTFLLPVPLLLSGGRCLPRDVCEGS